MSDHGIKPLREFEQTDPHAHMDHEKTTPVIAKHDFADGDDVPGSFFAMGPGIKQEFRLMGFEASVYDLTPTILHLYGIEQPSRCTVMCSARFSRTRRQGGPEIGGVRACVHSRSSAALCATSARLLHFWECF